ACLGGRGRTGTALARIAILDGVPARQAVRYVREHYSPRGRDIPPAALRDQVPRDQLTPVPRDLLLFEHGETRWQQRGRFPVTQAPPLREGRAVRQDPGRERLPCDQPAGRGGAYRRREHLAVP